VSLARLAAVAWTSINFGAYWRFRAALERPEPVQRALLRRRLREDAGTAFGRAHHFAGIDGVEEYQRRVPLARWADVAPWVDRIAAGERGVLTHSPVSVLESTGGSTAGKRIPYTAALQAELRRAIGPWLVDLVRRDPGIARGRAYWSISPALVEPESPGATGVRVGFEDDAAYLGGLWRRLVDATLAVPGAVRLVQDPESFRYATLRFLLQADDLAFISVWHPSFLTLLLDALPGHWDRLLADVADGTLHPPLALPPRVQAALARHTRSNRRRARDLERVGPLDVPGLWPRLRLVSCWADGHAAMHIASLQRRVPGVRIQPKGLLATEAFVSLPFEGRTPLAVRSHFFEFEDDDGRVRLAHELEQDGVYSVVVTTGGRLYRYRLEDRVQVDGFLGRTPSVRFLGKEGHVADLVGEKLREDFVASALARTFELLALQPRFALLAPAADSVRPRYALYLDCDDPLPPQLPLALDQALQGHGDYRQAVRLGQLAAVEVVRVGRDALAAYLGRCEALGQRLGAVKALALSPRTDWSTVYRVASVAAPTA
jgi:hypothetical protein